MAYWTLTEDCLVTLKRNWIKYYNDRLDALKELYEHSERQYRNEGNDDIRYGRYSTSSVHDWYDGKIRKLDEWIDNSIAELKNEDAKFDKLWKQACSMLSFMTSIALKKDGKETALLIHLTLE